MFNSMPRVVKPGRHPQQLSIIALLFCALLSCALVVLALRRNTPQPQVLAAADAPACLTEDGGRYLVGGGVLRCSRSEGAAAPKLASSLDLSFQYGRVTADGRIVPVWNDYTSPMVLEALGIMLCWIPKNSCTKFKQLFSRVGGDAKWKDLWAAHDSPRVVKVSQLNVSDVNPLLADPWYVRAVMIRDPVERFLSAYADKVIRRQCDYLKDADHPAHTVRPKAPWQPCNYTLSPDGVARYMHDHPRWIWYDHMSPQVNFCGFKSLGKNYSNVWNRIGYYDPSTISSVSSRLFDGRLDFAIQHGWDGVPEQGMWDTRTEHALKSHDTSRFRQLLCTNGTVLEMLYRAFAEDYEFFKLPVRSLCRS